MTVRSCSRLLALDHLRGFVVALVVLHHAILAYCRFGHFEHRHYLLSTAPVIDPQRWIGFDLVVLLNDSFFMPLMFLLSGLFVWRSLTRKGSWPYLHDRLLRLGLPFALAVLTITPLAYYPSWLQAGAGSGFTAFWLEMLTNGPWPSGPPWFVAVLLMFDAATVLAFALFGRMSEGARSPMTLRPSCYFGMLLIGSLLAYLPLLAVFGPSRWLSLGPIAVQASRIGLYAIYFAAGVAFGTERIKNDQSSFHRMLIRRWPGWILLAALMAAAVIGSALPIWGRPTLHGIALVGFCGAMCFAATALFLRFVNKPCGMLDSLAVNSYGIYLLHFPVVTWSQYGLMSAALPAIVKAAITFITALSVSWGIVVLIRRVPAIARTI